MTDYVRWLADLGMDDVAVVGGKNASLGEMIRHLSGAGVRVPGGFATTAAAYREFLAKGGLDQRIAGALKQLDADDVAALGETGAMIRGWIEDQPLPPALEQAVEAACGELMAAADNAGCTWAVRSSATTEDLSDASFAGQQQTLLNVEGLDRIKAAIKTTFASLYSDRVIAYRVHQGLAEAEAALSAGVQRMVRSDLAASGVIFTLDTESGFRDAVFVTASWGLGETVVQGAVNPDEFYVHKPTLAAGRPAILRRSVGEKAIRMVYADLSSPLTEDGRPVRIEDTPETERRRFCLTDAEVEHLARQAVLIEAHYGRPMDIEWAKDGTDGEIYIVQARPETVQSRSDRIIERYRLKARGAVVASGRSIGHRIGSGRARAIASVRDMGKVEVGDVLIADMTDPDWEPVMQRAAAIVTNRGGRTCHAAIVARELGVPAVVGCNDATQRIEDGTEVTVSCAEGDTGFVYAGALPFEHKRIEPAGMPPAPVEVMMNVGNPERAFAFAQTPHAGVGLARLEPIISSTIGIHPKALLEFDALPADLRAEIEPRIAAYPSPREFYIMRLAEGIATLCAAFAPAPVRVCMSDFESNEYANLIAGPRFEPREDNPMIGFRGAGRYVADGFRECFAMECEALERVRDSMGLANLEIMIPFVRTVPQAKAVAAGLAAHGLRRGENGLKIIMMCQVPSNALAAEAFLEHFDGFCIGSNDLTQLTLGIDRDASLVAADFDERDPAVKALLSMAIRACKARGKSIGLCGQGPSDHADFADWLIKEGIESLSLNPDTLVDTWLHLAERHPPPGD